jgi:hypothetical protein
MGTIDQRGEWRRVVTDGQGQAQTQAQGQGLRQDEPSPPSGSWVSPATAGQQRGIRLLSDGDVGRPAGRAVPSSGDRQASEGMDSPGQPEPDSTPGPVDASAVPPERGRRLRGDSTHAAQPAEPRHGDGRVRGPLSARVAQRHGREAVHPRRTSEGGEITAAP